MARQKSNDALDIFLYNLLNLEKEIIEMLIENNIDERIILDIIEKFYERFKIYPYNDWILVIFTSNILIAMILQIMYNFGI